MGVHGLAFIADGTKLLSASGDRTVAAWDVNTGGELGRAAFPAPLRCLSASGTNMVVGDAMGGFYYCRWHDSR
jgi:WD40 repeat protein